MGVDLVLDMLPRERLTPYLLATGHHRDAALALYAWNLRISESFYPLLSVTEIALRNTVAARIRAVYGGVWWDDPGFHDVIGPKAKGIVLKARNKRLGEKRRITHGCMVAELTFGFWSNMLLPKYEARFWTPLATPFPEIPDAVSLADLAQRCSAVTILRNRIFHHEALLRRDVSMDYKNTVDLLTWLAPDLWQWLRPQLRVMQILRERPRHRT